MATTTEATSKGNGSGKLLPPGLPPAVGGAPKPAQSAAVKVESPSPGALRVHIDDRRYYARWADPRSVDQLRVNVRLEQPNGRGRFHGETIDIYSHRSRNSFAAHAAKLLGYDANTIDQDLAEILMAVDRAQRQTIEAARAEAGSESVPEMTADERHDAMDLLKTPDLMDRIAADMEALGYVGEETNKKLGYLIAVSRKLPEPLNAIIISQSGAGKSCLANLLGELAPAEDVRVWSRITPQSLYYVERDYLKHKLVIIEERDGSDTADYAIRVLQSQHKLSQALPIKDPATGMMRTYTLEVEGPAAFFETTTQSNINPENASRSFELYLDESQAQTQRIHRAQCEAITPAGIEQDLRSQKLKRLHQNAQRLLEPLRVGVPYGGQLTFPSSSTRTRRDNKRLHNLLRAVTFLHQKQRRRVQGNDGEYIEATVEDYAIAYSLAAEVFAFGLDERHKPARDLFAIIETKVRERAEARGEAVAATAFMRRDVRQWSGWPNHQVKRAMQELEDLEYVEVERTRRGSRFTYQLVEERDNVHVVMKGMVTPVELFNRVEEAHGQGPAKGKAKAGQTRPEKKVEQSGKNGCPTTFRPKK
jgi:hypothetical protein